MCLECDVGKYELQRHLSMKDVQSFFSNGDKCSTSIVYISKNGPVHATELLVKNVDEECHYLYREKHGWYFVYTQLFKNIMLWSAHPRMFGKEGFAGHHITIGEQNGTVTLHHTMYSSKKHHIGQYNIIWDKTAKWYTTNKDGSLNSTLTEAVGVWNDIARQASASNGGGLSTTKTSRRHSLMRKGKTKAKKLVVSSYIDILQKRLKKSIVDEYVSKPERYMVCTRIPFLDSNDKKKGRSLISYVKKQLSTSGSATVVINHDACVSFILWNFDM